MKTKIATIKDEFTDYRGKVHKFIVAAMSQEADGYLDLYDEEGDVEDTVAIVKAVKIGVSVCNPNDEYDEGKGMRIAIGKANSSNDYALFSTIPGMINTVVVDSLLKQEAHFIKENPGRVIPGYLEEKTKYEYRMMIAQKIEALSDDEKAVYNAMKDHKYPKVEELLNA